MVAVSLKKKKKKNFFQAEDGIRDVERSRGLGDVYKRQGENTLTKFKKIFFSRTTEPILTKLGTKHPWMKGIQVLNVIEKNCFTLRKQQASIQIYRAVTFIYTLSV